MSGQIQIITTRDGSHSLLNTLLNETYHSVHGAVQESKHVFIKNGLEFFSHINPVNPINIFEMGFGTGLNAMLTARWSGDNARSVHYTSIESYPIPPDVYSQLNYAHSSKEKDLFRAIHECNWNEEKQMERFVLRKVSGEIQTILFPAANFDVIFYDAFAPSRQPELWEVDVLEKVISWMRPDAIFVTYCAKGQLKRDLRALGLQVETLPGPPGKKEMVRASRI